MNITYTCDILATLTTTCFRQAYHDTNDVDEDQHQRFEPVGHIFPFNTYKVIHCVMLNKELKTLVAYERCLIMGDPCDWTKGHTNMCNNAYIPIYIAI